MTRLSLAGINGANGIGSVRGNVSEPIQAAVAVRRCRVYIRSTTNQSLCCAEGEIAYSGRRLGWCVCRWLVNGWSAGVRVGSAGSTSFYYICPGPQPKGVICLIIV